MTSVNSKVDDRWEALRVELNRVCDAAHGSRSHLARFLGKSQGLVSNWMTGISSPSAASLLGILEWLASCPIRPNYQWIRLWDAVMRVAPAVSLEKKGRGRTATYPPSAYIKKKLAEFPFTAKPGDFFRRENLMAAAESIGCSYNALHAAVTGKSGNKDLASKYKMFLHLKEYSARKDRK